MNDPHQKRESDKYDNPIPSREYILDYVAKQPHSFYDLCDALEVTGKQKKPLTHRLKAMVRDRQLNMNREGMYGIFDAEKDIVVGTISANPKGFGFVVLDEGGKDLRLSSYQMKLVFHGDRVKVRMLDQRGDSEIIEVLESLKSVVGRLHINSEKSWVVVDDRRICNNIVIPKINDDNKNEQIVVVEIIEAPTLKELAKGRITQILGDYMDEGVETEAALYRNGIPVDFSEESLAQTEHLPTEVTTQDKQGRVDITDMKLVTIDGEDSRDFDDAVYAEPTANGWKLVVAIADVSHYVEEGTALDIDAIERGNSVYFPRRVVPMLPEAISNGLCSINPDVERLCMTCEMNIDSEGNLIDYKFYSAVMFSHARLTYTKVGKILEDHDQALTQEYAGVMDNLNALYDLYKTLKDARTRRGVMDFDRIETQILFDDKGKISNIVATSRNDAHKLIEECMLMANQATAKYLAKNEEDFLYRIHPKPTAEKVEVTRQFLTAVGLTLEGGEQPETKHFAKVLENAKGRDDENIIKTVVLRTMKQAVYTPANEGHFGLAFEDYTHFTSPIRRYPDLLVHRAIKRVLAKNTRKPSKRMVELGAELSVTERRADEATRDVEKWLKCEYMRDKVGETFNGVISGVMGFGIFIELTDVYTEGMISIRDMKDDYYAFDDIHHKLKGERTGKTFQLGDTIRVQVASVNLDDRQMVFVPAT
ncbi:3'-to-5' exoribonuclease RNase R [uncultured Gammaproteobacteria bacterium]|jgi:ribonuclease R|nr:3'-to-5' exoribonuclease RNase R [Bathymodiolus brooksi thiotrophic gill symbiont]CAC9543569.1 3'-to-5' exoribonuclease RNase R [uncultured Gammaproteobacteria bacterium]CAC9572786.1 3'-to-5' exoribonuclease RNase R [uncultured Gammaproteobacteria bacterium]CAC9582857.1 3'-to-5' exoribonuclease RNase R [uncultured Gammaproteobacteria bacterium]CAC9968863.1 3'-to-5' exoribonuclease RNase R [uncultured Gammaproteobacteria bacterium]